MFISNIISMKKLSFKFISLHLISLCFNLQLLLLVLFLEGVLSQIDHVWQKSDIPKGGNNHNLIFYYYKW